jgi:hypothetical protein
MRQPAAYSGSLKSGPDGSFALPGIVCPASLMVERDGFRIWEETGLAVGSVVVARLERGIAVEGRFVDGAGTLLEGAAGTIRALNGRWSDATVERGRFRFAGLNAGKNFLLFSNPQVGSFKGNVMIEPGAPPIDIRLEGLAKVSGRLVSAGKPVGGASVGAGFGKAFSSEDRDRFLYLDRTGAVRTGHDGRFSLSINAAQADGVLVYHPEYRAQKIDVPSLGAGGATDVGDVELVPGRGGVEYYGRVGIGGVRLSSASKKYLLTFAPSRQGAAKAGIQSSDEILSLDGVPLEGKAEAEVEALEYGPPWTHVKVEFRHAAGPPKVVDVERIPFETHWRLRDDGTRTSYGDL